MSPKFRICSPFSPAADPPRNRRGQTRTSALRARRMLGGLLLVAVFLSAETFARNDGQFILPAPPELHAEEPTVSASDADLPSLSELPDASVTSSASEGAGFAEREERPPAGAGELPEISDETTPRTANNGEILRSGDERCRELFRIADSYTPFQSDYDTILALELNHQTPVFAKDADESRSCPLLLRLTLALLAREKWGNEALQIDDAWESLSDDDFILKKGEHYPVDYLLYGLLSKQSDRALLVLAQHLADDEAALLPLLRNKMQEAGLKGSVLNYLPLRQKEIRFAEASSFFLKKDLPPYAATGTAADLAALYQSALADPLLKQIFSQAEHSYYSKDILRVFLHPAAIAWSLFPDKMQRALIFDQGKEGNYLFEVKTQGMDLLLVFTDPPDRDTSLSIETDSTSGRKSSKKVQAVSRELGALLQVIENNWTRSSLFRAGQKSNEVFRLDGQLIPLVFGNDCEYVHPKENDFILRRELIPEKNLLHLPVRKGQTVARLRITLENGQRLFASLQAENRMQAKVSLFNQVFEIYETYKGLCLLIAGLSFVFILLLLRNVVVFFSKRGRRNPS